MKRVVLLLIASVAFALNVQAQDVIRVLAIGNSFSEDVVEQHVHELGKAQGTTIIVGNLYIGGCSIQKHLTNLRSGKDAYRYRKVGEDGKKTTVRKVSMQYGLADEQWDYIMVQQVSGFGGLYLSFDKFLPEYMKRLRAEVSNKPKFIIMQTWAYQSNSLHQNFAIYDYDQAKMYKEVVKTYDKVFKDKQYGFHALVPNGTAIQNGRTYFGDTLTRDGFHLDKRVGRYLGACTMCEVLLGKSVVGNSYHPATISDKEALAAQKAAHAAVLKPTKVTKIK
jgi:hypothetical protein